MKLCTSVAAALLVLAIGFSTAQAEVKYWDITGTADGATFGDGIADGTWDGLATNWNTDPLGGAAGTISAWTTTTDDAVFSAGTDVGIDPSIEGAFIIITGTQTAASVLIEEGYIAFRSGAADTAQTTVKSGAILDIDSRLRFSALPGKITLQGGQLLNSAFGHAGSFMNGTQTLEVDGTGIIGYYDTVPRTAADCQCTIYIPAGTNGIKGVGGTPAAGTGTLIKTGAGEVRVQGAATANFSFEKLLIKEGLYRIGAGSVELGFGAAPPSLLTDQITLDGGEIGSSLALTLHANRGITITSNGGIFNNGGAGVMTIPGPLTGSGTMTLNGVVTSTISVNHGVSSGGTTLSHVGNVSTFSGNVVVNTSTLRLVQSLTTPNFSGGTVTTPPAGLVLQSVVTIGTVSIDSGKTFTAGSDGASTSYAGRVIGAGTFRKLGVGTLTMDAGQTDHDPASTVTEFNGQWTNTGGVIIDGGSIKFGTSLAGFGTTTPVTVNNLATLDMNNINDTFGSLGSDAGHTTGQVLQGAGNLTLGATTGTRTFEGTITGTGNFTKNGAATQILTGNNSLGAVSVTAGTLRLNGTNTTGAVAVTGGTLGGTGSVSGLVTVSGTGHVAPGASIGTFTAAGGLTLETGSILDFELAAPGTSDLLNVTLADGLTINGGSVSLTDAGGLAAGNYTLIDYVGTLMGTGVATFLSTAPTGPAGFDYMLVDTGSTIDLTVSALVTIFAGDYNDDGKVDAADYVVFRKNEGTANVLPNDPDGGTIGALQYNTWVKNFGNMEMAGSGGAGGGAVPEPSTVALLMIGLAAMSARRRSR